MVKNYTCHCSLVPDFKNGDKNWKTFLKDKVRISSYSKEKFENYWKKTFHFLSEIMKIKDEKRKKQRQKETGVTQALVKV